MQMHAPQAVEALSALAQESRLAIFRLLVKTGPGGMPAGEIALAIGVHPSTLSTHLAILGRAGLLTSRRDRRSIIYTARYESMRALLDFLVADCCDGHAEICGPLVQLACDGA